MRICECPGCVNTTRVSKPVCPEHIETLPYVATILEELDARDIEVARVAKAVRANRVAWRAVRLDGSLVSDILGYLRDVGPRTVERVNRERMPAGSNVEITEAFVDAMFRANLVTTSRTARGSTVVVPMKGARAPSA